MSNTPKPTSSFSSDAPADTTAEATEQRLRKAVHQYKPWTRAGLLERMFTAAFKGLVYPQIWEDPDVDLAVLELKPGSRMIAIGSGGCNVLSYLTADPAEVIAVDLNHHHVHLIRLKLAGLRHMPNYQCFFRFFGAAVDKDNPALYRRYLRAHLAEDTRGYWDSRDWLMRRRVELFKRNIYRYGLLGRFIAISHFGARLLGVRLEPLLEMRDTAEQRTYFDTYLAPLFEHKLVRSLTSMKASLFGLGIPPAQYDSLASAGGGDMSVVLKQRLEKLVCDFPIAENYFAQQAFGRGYPSGDGGPLPLYLQSHNFADLRNRADRVTVVNRSVTQRLADEPEGSMDAYVLLDAQDWMTDQQLNELWAEITRTAKPGSKVIFRTADEPSLLPGRVSPEILARWTYHEARSREMTARDRSAIYGGFHLYELNA